MPALRENQMRIRGKLALSFSTLVFLILLAFALIIYTTFAENIKHDRDGYFNLKTDSAFQKLTSVIHNYTEHLEIFILRSGLDRLTVNPGPADREELKKRLTAYLAKNDQVTTLAIAAPDGSIIVMAGADSRPQPVARRITTLLKNRKGEFKPGVFAQSDEVYLTYPFADASSKGLSALLLARLDTDALRKVILPEEGQKGTFLVVSKEGVPLFSFPNSCNADLVRNIARSVKHDKGPAIIEGESIFENLYIFSSSSPILGWDLSYAVPGDIYSREMRSLRNRMIAAILAITLISAGVILFISYRISRPIVALSQASKDIIDFDYTSSLDVAYTGDEIGELAKNFETMRRKIKDMVVTDHLTGIYNRRYFMKALESEINRAERMESQLCCLLMDIDHFKTVNDSFGHLCGDEVLKRVGQLLRETVREYDIVARYGGEEFVIILPETTKQEGFEIAERIRKALERENVSCEKGEAKFTVSIGVSSLEGKACTPDILINRADTALYQAKNAGRNKTMIYKG